MNAMNTQPTLEEQPLLSQEEAQVRTALYIQQRIDYQSSYYERRGEEFTFNADMMLWFSAGLMGVSTVISAYSILSEKPIFAFITALLPAFAAAISAFRSLYQWQRQASIYEDSWLALQQARLAIPDESFIKPGEYTHYLPELVRQTESVLNNEAQQWGQLKQVSPTLSRDGSTPAAK